MNRKKPEFWRIPVLLPLLLTIALALEPLTARAAEFVLLYSNDTVGELEPCG